MTTDEAINYLQPICDSGRLPNYKDALGVALDALRAQQKRENPQPLTLDELREMNGEPVYLAADKRWFLVNTETIVNDRAPEACGLDKYGLATSLDLLADCGMYRQKPMEGQK